MKRNTLFIVLILSLTVNVSVLATVGYHYWRNACIVPSAPCPLHPSEHHLYESLGLSLEQVAMMEPLAKVFHRRLADLESAVDGKRNLLIDLLEMNQFDQDRAAGIQKEIADLQDEIQKEVIQHIAESKKIMNPGQQKRFIELLRISANGRRFNPSFSTNGGTR
jgi:hypothetical protein